MDTPTWDGEALHNALCEGLGIEPSKRGAKREVAQWLGSQLGIDDLLAAQQRYYDYRSGRKVSMDALWRACRAANVRIVLDPGGAVHFTALPAAA